MDSATLEKLQRKNLLNLFKTGAFQFVSAEAPWFPYTSGQIGAYYVQSTTVEKDGEAYAEAIESLATLAYEAPAFDLISGGETRDWDFSNPLAFRLRKPHAKLYKDGRALGAELRGKKVLHVSDLNNEGSSVRDYWKPIIERNGGSLVALLSFVDRMEDGYTVLRELGLPLMSVVRLDARAWEVALETGHLTSELHELLSERMKDRHAWAIASLLRHPGRLLEMFKAPATKAKALRIIETYPEIEEQMKSALEAPYSQ